MSSSLFVSIQAATDAPLCRLAKGALEAECARRGLTLTLQVDAALAPPASWVTPAGPAAAVILAAPIAPAQPAGASVPVIAVELARLARDTRKIIAQLLPESGASTAGATTGDQGMPSG